MAADMPAALLMQGTTAGQQRIVATVSTLEEEVARRGAKTPAIIVVGTVCSLAEEFSWYEKMPLGGVKVLLTRPRERSSETAARMRSLGADVLEMPAIRTVKKENNQPLHRALDRIEQYQWLVFTSPAGVRIFFEEMADAHRDVRSLGSIRIAAIGSGTQKELGLHGLFADLVPEVFDGAHLGEALAQACRGGEQILIPRAQAGGQELIEALHRVETSGRAGVKIDDISIYDTVYEAGHLVDEKAALESGAVDYVVFTSASTVRGFAAALPGLDYTKIRAICIGRQTEMAAGALGMQTHVSRSATIDSLVACLVETHKKEQQ
jgi:uroporphyrinogen III methyltransferase/synthase